MVNERYKKTNEVLGEGSYKTVSRALDIDEGTEVAYNEVRIRKYEIESQSSSSFSKEIALLKNIDHPNIIRIFDYWFEEDNFIFVTELMVGGTLRDYISKVDTVSGKLIRKWGKQILEGLNYLHTLSSPIIHRDVKNENIFVNSVQGEIKIGDLGIARERKHKRYTLIGTLNYMAREMFEGDGYNEKVDIYAFGMCLLEMATGKCAYFECSDSAEVKKRVLQGVPPEALRSITNNCLKNLIFSCIAAPNNRFTAKQALNHHYFDKDSACDGNCIPSHCSLVYPTGTDNDITLYMVSFVEKTITFQIQLKETEGKESFSFIKFDYDLEADTVDKICTELIKENVIAKGVVDKFSHLLTEGIDKSLDKMRNNEILNGIFIVKENEISKQNIIFNTITRSTKESSSEAVVNEQEQFGTKTIEICKEIEEEIAEAEKMKVNRPLDKKVEEAIATSLKNMKVEESEAKSESVKSPERNSESVKSPERNSDSVKSSDEFDALSGENTHVNLQNIADKNIVEAMEIYNQHMHKNSTDSLASEGSKTSTRKKITKDLGNAFEITKEKYMSNCSIEEFSTDASIITNRLEEEAKQWIKAFICNEIHSVDDLKLLTADDWEKIPITVFACRTMQNMLYGIGILPPKDKALVGNQNIREYANSMPIPEFVQEVCGSINKDDLRNSWVNTFNSQDIRTVGELRALTESDWERLNLPILGYRILKNVIFRKGNIKINHPF